MGRRSMAKRGAFLPNLLKPKGAPVAAGAIITITNPGSDNHRGPHTVTRVSGPYTDPSFLDSINGRADKRRPPHWTVGWKCPRSGSPLWMNGLVGTADEGLLVSLDKDYRGVASQVRIHASIEAAQAWIEENNDGE